MKPSHEPGSDAGTGQISRRQAIQRIGGGVLTAVVLPRGLRLHDPSSLERETPPLISSDSSSSGVTPGPSRSTGLPRADHTMTPLNNGRLLVTGGRFDGPLSSVELYDPSGDLWMPAASLTVPRYGHAATLLADGRVLVTGGLSSSALSGVEIYDPGADVWTEGASLGVARFGHTAVGLPNGYVLVSGGWYDGPLSSMEIYDPASDRWSTL